MCDLEHCLAILKALGITEVTCCLSGGGDSGTAELQQIIDRNGDERPLPTITVGFTDIGGIVCLDERLDDLVANIPDGNWCNNEGGCGTVILHPQETDPDLQVDCNMIYGDDSDARDFDGEEEFAASDFEDADADGDTLIVDDSTLQPNKGDTP
jgi:hypothetical protein